jgi:hypothetical protein
MSTYGDELCTRCGGNGTLPVRNSLNERIGVQTCPRCDGRCYDPTPAPVAPRTPEPTPARECECQCCPHDGSACACACHDSHQPAEAERDRSRLPAGAAEKRTAK